MTKDEILELVKAGFTKEEILSMSKVEDSTVDNSTEVEYNVDENDDVENVEEHNEVKDMRNEFNEFMSTMQKEMQEQIKALQKFNIQHDKIQNIQPQENVDDVLAKIINPPMKEKERGK